MKLLGYVDVEGNRCCGRLAGDQVETFTDHADLIELVNAAEETGRSLAEVGAASGVEAGPSLEQLRTGSGSGRPRLAVPLQIPEAWGAGVTYRKSAEFRDEDMSAPTGIYDQVYLAERPELFYKGDHRHAVGPGEAVTIRSDSEFTAPEPELALVLASDGQILGYTLCNDNSAWDIERANPLYLPQSKVFYGCIAIGPVIVTADELPDPRAGELSARIVRDGAAIFSGRVDLGLIRRHFSDLVGHLTRNNPIHSGTILTTGTGIIVEEDCAVRDGDIVEISHQVIGTLSNPVLKLDPGQRGPG
ncbi:MAG: fumarylacetoacetate hydrolase family protein [Chloroflexi bacterium]|nr:fumarylacetoacetate hydrolase family protein [Chloroflexota bacterium]MDE2702966.1 fumarylacetoacetate hydrolase family protein [Chloroflexota bacterium]